MLLYHNPVGSCSNSPPSSHRILYYHRELGWCGCILHCMFLGLSTYPLLKHRHHHNLHRCCRLEECSCYCSKFFQVSICSQFDSCRSSPQFRILHFRSLRSSRYHWWMCIQRDSTRHCLHRKLLACGCILHCMFLGYCKYHLCMNLSHRIERWLCMPEFCMLLNNTAHPLRICFHSSRSCFHPHRGSPRINLMGFRCNFHSWLGRRCKLLMNSSCLFRSLLAWHCHMKGSNHNIFHYYILSGMLLGLRDRSRQYFHRSRSCRECCSARTPNQMSIRAE